MLYMSRNKTVNSEYAIYFYAFAEIATKNPHKTLIKKALLRDENHIKSQRLFSSRHIAVEPSDVEIFKWVLRDRQ